MAAPDHDLSPDAFASLLTESDRPPAAGTTPWDSALGLTVLRVCGPVLDAGRQPRPETYLAARAALGGAEAARRLLRAAGLDSCFVDTGLTTAAGAPLLGLPAFAALSGAGVREVVRLEHIAEQTTSSAAHWGEATRTAIAETVRAANAVAVKSVLAYRHGLDIDPARPTPAEVARAAGDHLAEAARGGRPRLSHPVLLRHLLWTAVDLRLPIQLHTGFGDPDLTLHRADPSLLTGFIRAVEPHRTPLVLLHCYPFHRQAAWLAQAFPHVYCDVGLTLSYTGPAAPRLLGETLELAPFGKVLFSTDAYGLPELHLVGATAFRDAVTGWTRDAGLPPAEAARLADLIGAGNADRLYGQALLRP
ncbi:amidohydrolase family protein [Streptomyces sp. SID4948]|nr:amidohydrolase family protein [Streptomyces sp. SID4948]